MPKTVEFKITGLKELQDKLEDLPKKIADRVLRKALKVAANRIKKAFGAFAPRDTGLLADHFTISMKKQKDEIAAMAKIGPATGIFYPKGGHASGVEEDDTSKGGEE